MKLKKVIVMATVFTAFTASTVFAGTWKDGAEPNQGKWWFDNGDGTYPANSWQVIDGNGDGISEYYYFDSDGWLVVNSVTPAGYSVNENGAWVDNGKVITVASNINKTANLLSGDYLYTKTDIIDLDTGEKVLSESAYDGTDESVDRLLDGRYKFGLVADPSIAILIKSIDSNSFIAYYDASEEDFNEEYNFGVIYANSGNKWSPTHQEAHKDWAAGDYTKVRKEVMPEEGYYWEIIDENTFMYYDTFKERDTDTGELAGKTYQEIRTYTRVQ